VNNIFAITLSTLAVAGLNRREIEIVTAIQAAIVEQRLPPGIRLMEEELADVYGVSRMRVRRVLLALAHAGMIDLQPGRGARVTQPTVADARGVFAARRLIEGQLLEAPEAKPGPVLLEELRELVTQEHAAARVGERAAMIRLSGAFHIALAVAYGNPTIAEIVGGLVGRSSLIIALFQTSIVACCRSEDHALLLDVLTEGDSAKAGATMRRHLLSIEAALSLDRRVTKKLDLKQVLARVR
jgi:DNA-binding GntR family transcriptional regulator